MTNVEAIGAFLPKFYSSAAAAPINSTRRSPKLRASYNYEGEREILPPCGSFQYKIVDIHKRLGEALGSLSSFRPKYCTNRGCSYPLHSPQCPPQPSLLSLPLGLLGLGRRRFSLP